MTQELVNVNKHIFICNEHRMFYRMTAMFYIDNEWFVGSGRLATPDLKIGNCITSWFDKSKLEFFTLDTEKNEGLSN